MIVCPVCGNEIVPAVSKCPFCESAVSRAAAQGKRPVAGRGGMRTVNIKEGLPTVEHALERLRNDIITAQRSRTRVLKVIHGYGSGGTGGAICAAVRSALSTMAGQHEIRSFYPGERFSTADNAVRQEARSVPALERDTDLGRANPGITVIFV